MKIKNKITFFGIVILSPLLGFLVLEYHDIWDFILQTVFGLIGALIREKVLRTQEIKRNNQLVELISEDLIEPIQQAQEGVDGKRWQRKLFLILTGKILALSFSLMSIIAFILSLVIDGSLSGSGIFDFFIAIPCLVLVSFWLVKSIKSSWNLRQEAKIKGTGLNWKCPNCGAENNVTTKICPYCRV